MPPRLLTVYGIAEHNHLLSPAGTFELHNWFESACCGWFVLLADNGKFWVINHIAPFA